VILISYFSSLIYRRTKIPDIIWLLVFGAILGPVSGFISTGIFRDVSPIISTLSIILITFEAGLDVDFKTLREIFPKTLILTLLSFILIVVSTTIIGPLVFPELTIVKAMILGTVLGGLSTVAVISIRDQIEIKEVRNAWRIMSLESTIVDPIRVMLAITLIRVALLGPVQPIDTFQDIFFILLIGSILGLFLGIVWSVVLHRLRGLGNHYMITLAVLLQVYFLAELLAGNGGGTMACFMFGFTISNLKMLSNYLGFTPRIDIKRLTDVNREISFALKSYYFVYTGLIVTLDRNYVFAGIAFTAMIIVIRFFAGTVLGRLSDIEDIEIDIIRVTYPLGTSALVFAQLPLIYDPQGTVFTDPNIFTNLVFPVVLGTIIFYSLIGPFLVKRKYED
jgi:cell volume regulation protein A